MVGVRFGAVLVVLAVAAGGSAQEKKNTLVLPPGVAMMSAEFSLADAAGGFAVPGSRVDVLGTATRNGKATAFVALEDVLVLAVGTDSRQPPHVTLSFAVTRQQALVLALAKDRTCGLSVLLRKPGDKPAGEKYDIQKVTKLLQDLPDPNVHLAPPPRAK